MKRRIDYKYSLGQSAVEYLLLLAVVAVVVIAAFGKGALVDKIHDTAGSYYNTVTTVIMDSDNGTRTLPAGAIVSKDTPNPINGGWCPITCPLFPETVFGSCECPPPAFGGNYCPGLQKGSVPSCAPGKSCPGAYQISCDGGSNSCSLTCNGASGTPIGSFPNPACTECWCPQNEYVGGNNTCVSCTKCPDGGVCSAPGVCSGAPKPTSTSNGSTSST